MTTYTRPDYQTLSTRISSDFSALSLPAVIGEPIAASWAKGLHGVHGNLEWVDAQCSPQTCSLERLYDWAALYGVQRLLATNASGFVLATGTPGTPILANTLLRGQNGLDYKVAAAVTLGAGSTVVQVVCLSAGRAGNLIAGQTLTLIDPIPGVASSLTVDGLGISGGEEDELVDDWRIRVVDEWQTVVTRGARSGKPEDYRFWAKSAHPSVSTALVYPHLLGVGTVLVLPICNGLTNRLPSAAVLSAVQAYFLSIAPATADWRVDVPVVRPVNVSIDLFNAVDNSANRAAIAAALSAVVLAESSESAVLAVAELDAGIATITNQYTRLAPLADIAVATKEVLVLQPIVWI